MLLFGSSAGTGHRGAEAVARDHEGRIVATVRLQPQGVQDSEHAEILGVFLGGGIS